MRKSGSGGEGGMEGGEGEKTKKTKDRKERTHITTHLFCGIDDDNRFFLAFFTERGSFRKHFVVGRGDRNGPKRS